MTGGSLTLCNDVPAQEREGTDTRVGGRQCGRKCCPGRPWIRILAPLLRTVTLSVSPGKSCFFPLYSLNVPSYEAGITVSWKSRCLNESGRCSLHTVLPHFHLKYLLNEWVAREGKKKQKTVPCLWPTVVLKRFTVYPFPSFVYPL